MTSGQVLSATERQEDMRYHTLGGGCVYLDCHAKYQPLEDQPTLPFLSQ